MPPDENRKEKKKTRPVGESDRFNVKSSIIRYM